MDRYEMPDDLRVVVVRFAEAVAAARIEVTSSDLDMALPQREYSSQEIEAINAYLAEQGIHLF
jgi:hypothetical protein